MFYDIEGCKNIVFKIMNAFFGDFQLIGIKSNESGNKLKKL